MVCPKAGRRQVLFLSVAALIWEINKSELKQVKSLHSKQLVFKADSEL